MPPPSRPDAPDEVVLTVPADPRYARVARLAVTGMAARVGFSYDEVEDLRIAVGEVCGLLLGGAADGEEDPRLSLRCLVGDGELRIEAARSPAGAELDVSDLSRQILAAVVDEATIDRSNRRVEVSKRHRA